MFNKRLLSVALLVIVSLVPVNSLQAEEGTFEYIAQRATIQLGAKEVLESAVACTSSAFIATLPDGYEGTFDGIIYNYDQGVIRFNAAKNGPPENFKLKYYRSGDNTKQAYLWFESTKPITKTLKKSILGDHFPVFVPFFPENVQFTLAFVMNVWYVGTDIHYAGAISYIRDVSNNGKLALAEAPCGNALKISELIRNTNSNSTIHKKIVGTETDMGFLKFIEDKQSRPVGSTAFVFDAARVQNMGATEIVDNITGPITDLTGQPGRDESPCGKPGKNIIEWIPCFIAEIAYQAFYGIMKIADSDWELPGKVTTTTPSPTPAPSPTPTPTPTPAPQPDPAPLPIPPPYHPVRLPAV